jgi:sugar lactone lactonase YvrE
MKTNKTLKNILLALCLTLLPEFVHAWEQTDLPINIFTIGGFYGEGEMQFIQSIASDENGNIYVADTNNDRVQKFTSDGKYLMSIHGDESEGGLLLSPRGVFVHQNGNLYISNSGAANIQVFNSLGEFLFTFGNSGTEDGQFNNPTYITSDSEGNIYISDTYNQRVQKFTAEGDFLMKFGSRGNSDGQFGTSSYYYYGPSDIAIENDGDIWVADFYNSRIQKFDSSGNFVLKFGTSGTGDGQFNYPSGLHLYNDEYLYIADSQNNRIQIFDLSGNYQDEYGSAGRDNGFFNWPFDILISEGSSIYVADAYNYRVQKFDLEWNYISKFGTNLQSEYKFIHPWTVTTDDFGNIYTVDNGRDLVKKYSSSGEFLLEFGGRGAEEGEFYEPETISIDTQGNIYVAEFYNNRVQKFDSNGNFLLMFGWGVDDGTSEFQICTSNCQAGISGSGLGQIKQPEGIVICNNQIYLSDTYNHRIQKFDLEGNYVSQFGSLGTGDGQLKYPWGIECDLEGNIYVADLNNHRYQKYDSSGSFLMNFGSQGSDPGQFFQPKAIAVDSDNYIYTIDNNHRLQKFDSTGNYIMEFGGQGNGDYEFYYAHDLHIYDDTILYVADTLNHRLQKYIFDRISPSGSISIQGSPVLTKSESISLNLNATDDLSSVYQMRISEDPNFSDTSWVPYSSTKNITLSDGDGKKNIYVQYVDEYTNYSEVLGTSILLDTKPPVRARVGKIGLIDNIPDRDNLKYYFYNPSLTISGSAEPNATVTFKTNNNTINTKAGIDGTFTLSTIQLNLASSSNEITYYQTDTAGNVGPSRTLTLVIGQVNFPEWLLERLGLILNNDEDDIVEDDDITQEEEQTTEEEQLEQEEEVPPPVVNTKKIKFTDKRGEPLAQATVEIEGNTYVTNSEGKIEIENLENRTYTAKIKTKDGKEYSMDILGVGDTEEIVVEVTDEDTRINWKNTIIYSGIGLVLLIVILIIFTQKKQPSGNY